MKWVDLLPSDFRKLVRDEGVCIVPIGSLERHGEHIPYGVDGDVAAEIAVRAAKLEPAVVFPTWYYAQVHEASALEGTINFPPEMMISMLRQVVHEIARNGFRKIVLLNGHGGNQHFLQYFDMALMEEKRDFTLYTIPLIGSYFNEEERGEVRSVVEADPSFSHAGEGETSLCMACKPGLVKLENQPFPEPILPKHDLAKELPGVYSAFWWYAKYPENVSGVPSKASEEKGRALLALHVKAFARTLRLIKADTLVPSLQKEFGSRFAACGGRG